tara:strand:- start:197 stop:520 length:324 start_codon:yes stop_codon:yes gene_type:complete
MKITKKRLLEIIKEEVEKAAPEQPKQKSFGSVRKTAQDLKKDFKSRAEKAVNQADEYTNTERGIVQQINDLLEQLALASDIDKGKVRGELMVIFKKLQKMLKIVTKS